MSEDPRDKAAALAEGMEAAGALIESLEQEVADLRSDLEEASAALKAAQEEVASSAGALEEKERASAEALREVEDLRRRFPASNSVIPTNNSASVTSTSESLRKCAKRSKSSGEPTWMRRR